MVFSIFLQHRPVKQRTLLILALSTFKPLYFFKEKHVDGGCSVCDDWESRKLSFCSKTKGKHLIFHAKVMSIFSP
jgi:hypothetical protein